ncbi:hypothetical protein IH779_01695 [Patescibacteria group bacterium]|nr:hypothetical protein [Patescibacteria group bacterium]
MVSQLRKFKLVPQELGKLPIFSQWKQVSKVLKREEKIALSILFFLVFASGTFFVLSFYFHNTEIQPAIGGVYTEGVLGKPQFINPIYAQSSDVDRDLTELLFSGLLKYNEKGEIIPDLAREYKIEDEGTIYEIYLRDDILWSDGKPFSAEDVIFTIKIIQDPDYKSPLRASLLGVTVEKISNARVRFKLKKPYPPFLETLTLKILPKHIWQDIPPRNFPLAVFNLQPVGTGLFKFKSLTQDQLGSVQSIVLVKNPNYFGKKPFLREITFRFFDKEEDLITALEKNRVMGISSISPQSLKDVNQEEFKIYRLSFPRYFSLSFNLKNSDILAKKETRKALNYGTDKEEIIKEVLLGEGKAVHSPFLQETSSIPPSSEIYPFNLAKAKEILEEAGWEEQSSGKRAKIIKQEIETLFRTDLELESQNTEVRNLQECLAKDSKIYPEGEITGYFGLKTKSAVTKFQEKYAKDILDPWGFTKGTGIVSKTTRAKLNEVCVETPTEKLPLKLSLITVDQKELSQVAELLQKQWIQLGVDLEITKINLSTLQQDYLRQRNYEILLFGKVTGLIIDPYPFWHSSQTEYPGLNLSGYKNKEADSILEEARKTLNAEERTEKYERLQEILIADAPAVFLYTPNYLYLVSKKIQGIEEKIIADPSKRFIDIGKWYIKTRRVWK